MHEKRNFFLVLGLMAAVALAVWSWFLNGTGEVSAFVGIVRPLSLALVIAIPLALLYVFKFEDKLPDHLGERVGELYFEVDGISFLPTIRRDGDRAELCVYYQNRFDSPADTIVHLRPPQDSFVIRPGMTDVHFAFRAGGGDFGVLHQPIAVPAHLQGEVLDIELAASSHYQHSHGSRVRRKGGMPCGSLHVDWAGNPLKAGVHEVVGEIELLQPATLHLAMPRNVANELEARDTWTMERIHAGKAD